MLWHWPSLQVLCELGFRTGHFCAGCLVWAGIFGIGSPCKFSVNLLSGLGTSVLVVLVGTGCAGTGCPCRFSVNLTSGLGTSVLAVLLGAGCCGTGCPYRLSVNLVSGLGTSVLAVLVGTGCWHWLSLQVLCELGQDWALLCWLSWLGLGCFGTGCPCKFSVNLLSGLGTSVLAVLVGCELGFRTGHFGAGCPDWDWVRWHWPSLQVLCVLGFRTGRLCAGCLGWGWVRWHWPSLQVLSELGFRTGHFCAGCPCWGWVRWLLLSGLSCKPAQVRRLLCVCGCCLPLWLAWVLGSCVSQYMLAARCELAAVACLCGLHGCSALMCASTCSCLLCACSCCLPLWLAWVLGSGVSQHTLAACGELAAVACLCGLHECWALVRASTR